MQTLTATLLDSGKDGMKFGDIDLYNLAIAQISMPDFHNAIVKKIDCSKRNLFDELFQNFLAALEERILIKQNDMISSCSMESADFENIEQNTNTNVYTTTWANTNTYHSTDYYTSTIATTNTNTYAAGVGNSSIFKEREEVYSQALKAAVSAWVISKRK